MVQCRIDGCERSIFVKKESLCQKHYSRLRRHGDPEAWKKPRRPECSVNGCAGRAAGHGLCDMHYRRQRRYGTTDRPERPTVCAVAECGLPVAAHALCDRHYRRDRRGANGPRYCRFCGGEIDQAVHARNAYCSPEHRAQDAAIQRRENHRERWLKRYGMTIEQYEQMLASQGGCCAICRTGEVPSRGWHVDHDHATGRVRGILCHGCNVSLGHFRDSVDLLQAAVVYLQRS
jgi:hypothetical protein